MDDSPTEVHEIVGHDFRPCGAYVSNDTRCSSVRRFAIRRVHIGLYCGVSTDAHNIAWYPGLQWAKPADFVDFGPFAGWVPDGAFPSRRRSPKTKRTGGWALAQSVRYEFEVRSRRPDARCSVCEATWFRAERNSEEAFEWLRTFERTGLVDDVADAIRKMVPKPSADDPTWYNRLPPDLRLEVKFRFDDSQLRADHALSIRFLRAAMQREGRNFSVQAQRFGVNGLVFPLCEKCNRGKGVRLFDTRAELLNRWAAYRFAGNIAAARLHPDYVYFEYLCGLAYETGIVEDMLSASRQRERKA